MRKWITLITVALLLAGLNVSAWARGPRPGAAGASQATVEQRQAFWKDTEAQRQALQDKLAQLNKLLASSDSDPAEIGRLEKEIYSLRTQIRERAQKAGFNCPGPCMGAGSGGWGGGRGPCFMNTTTP